MEEQIIIRRCIRKESTAQRQLFDRHYRHSYHVAMRYLANHHDTEDVLSVSFTRVLKNIDRFEYRGNGSLQKWVITVVINESIRFLKGKKALLFQEDDEVLSLNVPQLESDDSLDIEEVQQVLQQMPKGYRTVFNLFAIEGYSHKEIGEMLKINESTSKSQLCKARNYMIRKLKNRNSHATQ
ncbi:sigma-70 family RNA polymerase sigma factor [Cyclobacterium sp.]|uniref:RNA polymerase sigma factor n=1 Tax=Cyclobacterium sp. TaxID=1966343 RepID=UPI00198D49FA|nr:sigma-70 family RNA polymerase sigma factor [Cyclobacterium sp.]MBD3630829.1 sigma-70 family RNA polymerase sigma factor [Cyclobacterium sp.]